MRILCQNTRTVSAYTRSTIMYVIVRVCVHAGVRACVGSLVRPCVRTSVRSCARACMRVFANLCVGASGLCYRCGVSHSRDPVSHSLRRCVSLTRQAEASGDLLPRRTLVLAVLVGGQRVVVDDVMSPHLSDQRDVLSRRRRRPPSHRHPSSVVRRKQPQPRRNSFPRRLS